MNLLEFYLIVKTAAFPRLPLKSGSVKATLVGGVMCKWFTRKRSGANWQGHKEEESEGKGGPAKVIMKQVAQKTSLAHPPRECWWKSHPRAVLGKGKELEGLHVCIPGYPWLRGQGSASLVTPGYGGGRVGGGQSPGHFQVSWVQAKQGEWLAQGHKGGHTKFQPWAVWEKSLWCDRSPQALLCAASSLHWD